MSAGFTASITLPRQEWGLLHPSSPAPSPRTSPWSNTHRQLAANTAAPGRDRAAGPPTKGPNLPEQRRHLRAAVAGR